MANLPSDLAESISQAKVAGGGVYIQHGDYIAGIKEWSFKKVQDRCVILELIVVDAKKKAVYEGSVKVEQEPNAPSTVMSDVANFDGDGKLSAEANSLAPLIGLYGLSGKSTPTPVLKKSLKQALKTEEDGDPDLVGIPIQPAKGMLLTLSTFPKEIRSNKGNYITGRNYGCVNPPGFGLNAPEALAARKAALAESTEKFVEVALAQIAEAKAAGTFGKSDFGNGATQASSGNGHAGNGTSAGNGHSAAPDLPPDDGMPDVPAADPMDGWNPHPKNPAFFYKKGFKKVYKKEDIVAGRATE